MDKISITDVCKMGFGFTLGYITVKFIQNANKNGKDKEDLICLYDQCKKQQQQNQRQIKRLAQLQDLLTRKASNFYIKQMPNNPQILSKKCLLQFISQTSDILSPQQIIEITENNRKARRQVFANIQTKYQTYFRFVCTLDENIKYVLDKAQKDFAIFLNIDYKRIMDSISYHIENQQNEESSQNFKIHIVQVMSSIRQNLANYMPLFNKPISAAQLKEVIAFQTQTLKGQKQQITRITKKLGLQTKQEEQSLPLFLTCYIEDSTWLHYNIQSQQMSVLDEDMDNDLRLKFEQFKRTREDVIKQIHMLVQDNILLQQ